MRLTEENIKTLKKEKRLGYTITAIVALADILMIACLYFFVKYSELLSMEIVYIAMGVALIVALMTPYIVNRKINQDLHSDRKLVVKTKIQKKEDMIDYEANGNMSPDPILADLLPKLMGRKTEQTRKQILIIDNQRHIVTEDIYNSFNEGDEIEAHFGPESKILLEIKKLQK